MNASKLISSLDLEAHVEGGFYRRTFQADHRPQIDTPQGKRYSMTSIYYLLSENSPIGHFHLNKSDIAHFFHSGSPVKYYLISPSGEFSSFTLGNNIEAGERFQFVVPGGWWKASELVKDQNYDYGLISEAVAPGFDFNDMRLANREELLTSFPEHKALITKLTRTK